VSLLLPRQTLENQLRGSGISVATRLDKSYRWFSKPTPAA
jgi:AraC family transcriptional activator of tynA and feaB